MSDVVLAENMRSGNTARVNAARVGGFRCGAAFSDIKANPSTGDEYFWSQSHQGGVKKMDNVLNDTQWTVTVGAP